MSNAPKISKENLGQYIPRPGDNLGHVVPYVKDDWRAIELIQDGIADPNFVKFKIACVACLVVQTFGTPRVLFDKEVKWLCDDCRDKKGFAWLSQILGPEATQFQEVRIFKDDTLMRDLRKSVNPKDPMHDPFAPESNRKTVIKAPDLSILDEFK